MAGRTITIKAEDGANFAGFLALPDAESGPGIVVLQEVFGVNFVMRELCHQFAAQGYLALCPDLFWRQEANVELCDKTEGDWGKAFAFYESFQVDLGVKDANSAMQTLREFTGCTGKIGTVGYCLGGLLAYLTATRTDVDASVGYYGVGIETNIEEQSSIKAPHMTHIAEDDPYVPQEAQMQLREGFANHRLITVNSYPGANHAFARLGGEHFDEKSASLANKRTADFFKQHLN